MIFEFDILFNKLKLKFHLNQHNGSNNNQSLMEKIGLIAYFYHLIIIIL